MSFPETETEKEALRLLRIIKSRLDEMNTVTINGEKYPPDVEMELTIRDRNTGRTEVISIE